MYLTLFTTFTATSVLLMNSKLNIPYMILIGVLTIVGTIPGLIGQKKLVQWTGGRNQFTVMILLFFLVIILLTALPLGIVENLRALDSGEDIAAFNDFCD